MFGGVIMIYVNCLKLAEFIFKKKPLYLKDFLTNKKNLNYVYKFKFFQMVKD